MSISTGTATLKRYYISGNTRPSSDPMWIESLSQGIIQVIDTTVGKVIYSASVFENELSQDFDLGNMTSGKFVMFAIRINRTKIIAKSLELLIKSRVYERIKSTGLGVSQKAMQEIREDVLESHIDEVSYQSVDYIHVVIDTVEKCAYFNTTSGNTLGNALILMSKMFGFTLDESTPHLMASRQLNETIYEKILDNPRLGIFDTEIHPEFEDLPELCLGSSFLTWAFHYFQTGDAAVNDMTLMVEDTVKLEGEALGAKEALLKKGNINTCVELFASLKVGKTISRMKFVAARSDGEETYYNSFEADKDGLVLKSCKVKKHRNLLHTILEFADCFAVVDHLFARFLAIRYNDKVWPQYKEAMKEWIR